MREISFQPHKKKETIIKTDGKEHKLNCLEVSGLFLNSFFPLLKRGSLPQADEVLQGFEGFLEKMVEHDVQTKPLLRAEDNGSEKIGHQMSEENLAKVYAFLDNKPTNVIDHAVEILTARFDDKYAATIWLEFLALLCGIYYWLAPKKEKNYRRSPGDMFTDLELSKFNDDTEINRLIQAALEAIKEHKEGTIREEHHPYILHAEKYNVYPFDPPMLRELITDIFSRRTQAVGFDLDFCYPNIPDRIDIQDIPYQQWMEMRYREIRGVKYIAYEPLQLAWLEVLKAIEHNIFCNICFICGTVFPIHTQYGKTKCGSKECTVEYDKRMTEKKKQEGITNSQGIKLPYRDYMRKAKQKSRQNKSND